MVSIRRLLICVLLTLLTCSLIPVAAQDDNFGLEPGDYALFESANEASFDATDNLAFNYDIELDFLTADTELEFEITGSGVLRTIDGEVLFQLSFEGTGAANSETLDFTLDIRFIDNVVYLRAVDVTNPDNHQDTGWVGVTLEDLLELAGLPSFILDIIQNQDMSIFTMMPMDGLGEIDIQDFVTIQPSVRETIDGIEYARYDIAYDINDLLEEENIAALLMMTMMLISSEGGGMSMMMSPPDIEASVQQYVRIDEEMVRRAIIDLVLGDRTSDITADMLLDVTITDYNATTSVETPENVEFIRP